ncbi:MAG TPA: HAD hydrolase-like protein [Candidatus Saccharimonadia bacterium]|nr:HAD hydrolase-like protein [Candidatus Saccharimonadia bacterium]
MDELYSPSQNTYLERHFSKAPNYVAASVMAIDYDRLFAAGIRHLVFDVDNTLVSYGEPVLQGPMLEFLKQLKARPEVHTLRLASNSRRDLSTFGIGLGIDVIKPWRLSFKPLPSFYRRILANIGPNIDPKTVAMVGDKLIQDVWGANYAGMTTVLVQPLGRDFWLDRLLGSRRRERRLLRKYLPHHIEAWF